MLDVLLLEATPGDGRADTLALEAAGHRVHRCFPEGSPPGAVHPSGWAPCQALTEGRCPLDEPIDVALLARHGMHPRPEPGEAGIRCAVRAGVPVVEDGGDLLDPFAPWIARRTDAGGVVAACEEAARDAMAPVVDRLRVSSDRLLRAAGVHPDEVDAAFEIDRDRLVVRLTGPELPAHTARALCDRARGALSVLPRRFARVDVGYAAT